MDIDKLAKETILKNMTPDQQKAVLESVMASVQESKKVRTQKIAENVDLVMQALKKIEAQMLARVNKAADTVETVAKSVKDGKDGRDGKDGKAGKDGVQGLKGADGRNGKDGKDGKDGRDGVDGVSVVNAFLDFDNSLVIELSNGKQINVGGILADDAAEKVRVVANGGGTSQGVLDAIAALQTAIATLIPSQTGNSGKFLTTNGSVLSWASVAGGLSYQGTWNASTNSPTLASGAGTNGYYYVVATAGSTNLDGVTDWQIGDWLLFNGSTWQKIDQTNLVTSVAGRTGAITLSNSDVSGSAASGANSDITSMSGITGGIATADYLQLDTTITPSTAVAKLQWDTTWGGPQIGMEGGNVNLQIGQETLIKVYNNTGSSLTDGQVVYVTGSQGQRLTVGLAKADSDSTSATIIGMVTEPIENNTSGFVTTQGMVNNINTSGSSDGAVIYLSPTTAGAWTTTKPVAPQHMVMVGYIVKGGSVGGGSVYINTQNGYELEELHNVLISSAASGNTLIYDASAGVWKNANISAGTGISVTNGVGSITVANSAPMTYPSSGIPNSTGSAWGTSYSTSGTGTTIALTSNPTFASETNSGDYTFTGTANRITGDFSNATTASRVLFQTSTTNGATRLGAFPNGTSQTAGYYLYNSSDVANASVGQITQDSAAFYFQTTNTGTGTALPMYFATAGTERMRIDTSGNVGIGTSSPADKLEVAGNLRLSGSGSSTADNAQIFNAAGFGPTINGYNFAIKTGATTTSERFRIDSSGNVGIGTSSPTAKATVASANTAVSSRGNLYVYSTDSATADYGGQLALGGSYSGTSEAPFANLAGRWTGSGINGYMQFSTLASGTLIERMRIDSSGNIGIGTSSPDYQLDVSGTSTSTTTLGVGISVENLSYTTNTRAGIVFRNGDNYGASVWSPRTGSSAGALVFGTNNAGGTAETNIVERMRIDSNGNVGIGTTTTYGFKQHIAAGSSTSGQLISSTTTGVYTNWSDGTATNSPAIGGIGNNLVFATGAVSNSERMRIDSSGNLLVGKTATTFSTAGSVIYSNGEVDITRDGNFALALNRLSSDGQIAQFYRQTSQVGSISVTTTTTTYSTSSDYRLKEDITPMTGALDKVAALRPVTYKWKADGSVGEGFIAHELGEVVPQCVSGEKDAVDAEGNPVYQGIDTSFLVATLTAAIQEQQILIQQLTQRIETLEAK